LYLCTFDVFATPIRVAELRVETALQLLGIFWLWQMRLPSKNICAVFSVLQT
jgi:hypothetical protein